MSEGPERSNTEDVAPPLEPGEPLGTNFTLLRHLSRGRVLDVYEVWSAERWCSCAAKVLRPDRISDRPARERLIREGHLLRELTHPHIVRGFETFEQPEPVVILEALTGETLARMLRRRRRPNFPIPSRRRLSLAELVALGTQVCSATQYLHRHGLLHLDLKPGNIVSDRGMAKLLDLSIAGPPGHGRKGRGTRFYMAPEQARGGLLSEAADVWGIGMVLFEAATLRRPFAADGSEYPQLRRRAPSVRARRRLPPKLSEALDACLEPEPEDRPAIDQLYETLESLL